MTGPSWPTAPRGTPFEAEARLALLAIYERSSDWPLAAAVPTRWTAPPKAASAPARPSYLCEQAAALLGQGTTPEARSLLERAIATAPHAARARIDLAALQQAAGDPAATFDYLRAMGQAAPAANPSLPPGWPTASDSIGAAPRSNC